MTKTKIFLYSILLLLCVGFVYLYIWEKPKLEKVVQTYVENLSKDDSIPVRIKIGKTNFSFIPLQVELYETEITPKNELAKSLNDFKVRKIAIRPSLLDLLIGKFWISLLKVEGSEINLNIKADKTTKNNKAPTFDFDKILKRIPLSQANLTEFKLDIAYGEDLRITTESLFLKAYNEKSSVILTVKDPNLGIRTKKDREFLHLLTEVQLMATSNTVSLSKFTIVKDKSVFFGSGNLIYRKSLENIEELNIKTRLNSDFQKLQEWSNIVHPNSYFDSIQGRIKTDLQAVKTKGAKGYNLKLIGDLKSLQIGKIKLGDFLIKANAPSPEQINVDKIEATMVGNNTVKIENGKVKVLKKGKRVEFTTDVTLKKDQLHSFLKDSGIADIPVWLNLGGQMKCIGSFENKLTVDCPGALTVSNLKIMNGSRTKNIVSAKKIDIAGSMRLTEKNISYKAKATLGKTQASSTGVIDFDKGFEIEYDSPVLDFTEVGRIADLKFVGVGSTKGTTRGDSRWATFSMDLKASNFEFEDYFFGEVASQLSYKTGSLFFDKLSGNIESTRFSGNLTVDLLQERILGDLQLPFFRMEDVQQAIIKKLDLQNRFLGSGSGRVKIDTSFDTKNLNFAVDARLFKGQAFGEEYNEAKVKAEAVEGIIIVQEAQLQKEKSIFNLKGTLDSDFNSDFEFTVASGFLQLSTNLKKLDIPISGEFSAEGKIFGSLKSPNIKTQFEIEDLIFNKRKYGNASFRYDNSNKQTNLKFDIPEQLDFLVIFPESKFDNFFLNVEAEKFDLAPIVGFAVSEEATRSYRILTSGEISGNFNSNDLWASEFSSIVKDVKLDYKSNNLETTIPTSVELKGGKLFLNEISLIGTNQHIKITQPYTEKYRTKFVINSRLSIAFFKLFAPFLEKIDGYSTQRLELSINKNNFKLIGSSYTKNSFIKFPGFPHPFENVRADVLFNQNKVLINSIAGELAGGKVLGNGEVLFPAPGKFDLVLNANIENTSLNFPEGYKTNGSANISLTGDKIPFLLAGTYTVQSGLIESNFSSGGAGTSTDLLEELLKKEVSSPLVVNIDIETKNPVEVRNSLVEGYMVGNFKVFDKITAPRIKGDARFEENAIVRSQDQEFEVTSSNFEFTGQSPINPKLSMRAETRMNGYDIELFLQGRASKPKLTLSSQPPLPETQIISMLALGQVPTQFDQNNNENIANTNNPNSPNNNSPTSGFEVGTSLLGNNPLGQELKRYGVDVEFSSSFDDQNNAAVPRLTLRRKVGKDLQVSVSSTTGNTNQQEGRVTYQLNKDLSTIFRITNQPDDNNNLNNTANTRQTNPFGVDLEYRVEFD